MKPTVGSKLNRAWRVVATAYCFVFFGVAAVIFSATVFPALRLFSRDAEQGRIRIQRAVSRIFTFFVRMMRAVGVLTYEMRGLEKLRGHGQLIVANHPTLIDVVFLVSMLPAVDCIVKDSLWRNPFLRWPVLWAGYIPNRTAEQLVATCAQTLRAGRSLLVFPEGTRTVPGQSLTMRRGAAQIALAARVDILPITISCEPLVLAKTLSWHDGGRGRPHFVISVNEAIPIADYLPENLPQSLAARGLTRYLEKYFSTSRATLGSDQFKSATESDFSSGVNAVAGSTSRAPVLAHSSLQLSFNATDVDSHANS